MTIKEVTRKLLALIEKELKAFDFKLDLKEQGFLREENGVIYFYFFLIYNEHNIKTGAKGFLIEPYAKISNLSIEKYYKKITINSYLKSKWDFNTIGNSLANLIANPDGINRKRNESLRFYVWEEAHIKLVANALLKLFKEFALLYFLENSSVKRIDMLLNSHPREYTVHMVNDLFRFVKGVIAAKLDNNPESDNLLTIYNTLIDERDMPDDCRIEMKRLADMLPEIK
ncbi:hypothetical protein [Chitinophaga sp. OAE865]|uniref:hypothetical protein n=1 Tax=Chitinophaga sp. OAE865 TaxID=2817898 RepID=UPI001AE40A2A